MDYHVVLLIISLSLFLSSLVLWFISGVYMKRNNSIHSKIVVYIGGFMFTSSLLCFIVAIILWAGK